MPTENRERVLRAATDSFLARGYASSVEEIARRAGVAKQTVYSHFPSKDRLFREVARELAMSVLVELEGGVSEILPVGAEELERCEPVYEELPGWMESTVGIRAHDQLPKAARAYLQRIQGLAGVPIDLISTGPERDETIVRRHPYDPG